MNTRYGEANRNNQDLLALDQLVLRMEEEYRREKADPDYKGKGLSGWVQEAKDARFKTGDYTMEKLIGETMERRLNTAWQECCFLRPRTIRNNVFGNKLECSINDAVRYMKDPGRWTTSAFKLAILAFEGMTDLKEKIPVFLPSQVMPELPSKEIKQFENSTQTLVFIPHEGEWKFVHIHKTSGTTMFPGEQDKDFKASVSSYVSHKISGKGLYDGAPNLKDATDKVKKIMEGPKIYAPGGPIVWLRGMQALNIELPEEMEDGPEKDLENRICAVILEEIPKLSPDILFVAARKGTKTLIPLLQAENEDEVPNDKESNTSSDDSE